METASSLQLLDWAVAQRAVPGESVSGDRYVVHPHRRGVLLGVVDGCGHGPEAARAATLALSILNSAPESSLEFHFKRCHAALGDTRGVVMTLGDFHARNQTLTLAGIGNVEATLFRAHPAGALTPRDSALLRGGVVGAQMPPPYAGAMRVQAGDVLLLTTDGLKTDFDRAQALQLPPQRLADLLLEHNFKGTDDALVLVVRFRDSP